MMEGLVKDLFGEWVMGYVMVGEFCVLDEVNEFVVLDVVVEDW